MSTETVISAHDLPEEWCCSRHRHMWVFQSFSALPCIEDKPERRRPSFHGAMSLGVIAATMAALGTWGDK